jgi:hypothetical protein
MANLTNPKAIWAKGILFCFLGVLASTLLISRTLDTASVMLHVIAIWAFCRCYYFAFYVIEHYVDPSYRFAGLIDFLQYALRKKKADRKSLD